MPVGNLSKAEALFEVGRAVIGLPRTTGVEHVQALAHETFVTWVRRRE